MAEAWALIRKTQSHIITLDETKEDNPVVRLGYFRLELNYSCFLTYHGAQAFCSWNAICFFQTDALKWTYQSKGSTPKHPPFRGSPQCGTMLAICSSTAVKTEQINSLHSLPLSV